MRGFGYLTTSLGRSLLRVSTQKTENFMPLYNYECTDCGPFEEWQSMSQSAEPNTCTNCGEQSKRAMSTPGLALMSANTRTAHFRNEKSASNPEVVNKPKNVSRRRAWKIQRAHASQPCTQPWARAIPTLDDRSLAGHMAPRRAFHLVPKCLNTV